MKEMLVIVGASGHGKVIADIALLLNQYKEIVFLDDNETVKTCYNLPVVGKVCDAKHYIDKADFIIAIGNAVVRKRITEELEDASFVTLIHPSAIISSSVTIQEGTVVMAGAIINPEVKIGKSCIINTASSIDHECIIEDYVHISVGAHLAGNVHAKENTWIGAGSIINNNLTVTKNCMIGSGAVVIKDIIESGTYVGVPVRKL